MFNCTSGLSLAPTASVTLWYLLTHKLLQINPSTEQINRITCAVFHHTLICCGVCSANAAAAAAGVCALEVLQQTTTSSWFHQQMWIHINKLKHTILQASYNFQKRISGINAEHFHRLDNIPITQSTVKAHKTSHSIFNDNFRGG